MNKPSELEIIWKRITRTGEYYDKPIKWTEFKEFFESQVRQAQLKLLDSVYRRLPKRENGHLEDSMFEKFLGKKWDSLYQPNTKDSVHNPCPYGNDDCPKCKPTEQNGKNDKAAAKQLGQLPGVPTKPVEQDGGSDE
jgi:hypothetical protein